MASTATPTEPSVPFLKPIGNETPEASSLREQKAGKAGCLSARAYLASERSTRMDRWSCDSVVRAPIAPHETRSAMNWGLSDREAIGLAVSHGR